MSQDKTINRSKAIRDYLATNKKASPKQIVEGLKANGIEVTHSLANFVKYSKPKQKKGAGKAPQSRKIAKGDKAQPAVSGSESIRRYIAKHPGAGPKQIQDDLTEQGINVSRALVTAVKYSKTRGTVKRGRPARGTAARRAPSMTLGFNELIEAKKLVESLGGVEQVRNALAALDRLR